MPLWSSSSSGRSTSYSSSSTEPPQLPPLPEFTPPSTSHLPHFDKLRPSLSHLSISHKGKHRQDDRDPPDDDEDDPWRDGSDDESTVNPFAASTTTPSVQSPTAPTPPTTTTTSWFSSLTSPFTSSSSSTSAAAAAAAATPPHPAPPSLRGTLRRQPSAKDVALALSPSPSPSLTLGPGGGGGRTGLERSGGSYIGKVNEVQKLADQLVQHEEEQARRRSSSSNKRDDAIERNSDGRTGPPRPGVVEPDDDDSVQQENRDGRGEHGGISDDRGGGKGVSSERERLRDSIRPDVFDLVKDPTSVLPRLRREWLTHRPPPRPPRPPRSASPDHPPTMSTASTTTTNAGDRLQTTSMNPSAKGSGSDPTETLGPRPARLSISSDLASEEDDDDVRIDGDADGDDDDGDGRPRAGYVALNASSLSSTTSKVVVDYQREYGLGRPPPSSLSKKRADEEDAATAVRGIDLLEAPGEVGREARRRKKFLDVLQGVKPGEGQNEDEESEGEDEEGSVRGDEDERERRRRRRTRDDEGETDLGELRKLSWGGVPPGLRVVVWMLLLGYLPSPFSRRVTTLARKRQEYADAVKLAFSRGVKGLDGPIWHQISIDVPRTRPGVKLWMVEGTQRSLERILYVWAIRHPASGYVQGINDLVTPFFQVFLSLYIDSDPEEFDPSLLPACALEALEADSFWCLSKLLDGIQDNYIFAQPGITRAVKKMQLLCQRVDRPLAQHLEREGVEFIQFAFRWMNCLLMRELSVKNIVRMWDTYLAEGGDAFSEFHLYVCLSFLVKWSEQLRTMDFQSIIMFLQSLPTRDWKDSNTELLLSEAFMWSRTFEAR